MMLLLCLPYLIVSNPNISFGIIDGCCSDETMKEYHGRIEEFAKLCKKDPSIEGCDELEINSMSNGNDIESFISGMSDKTGELYLIVSCYTGIIDFNKLRNKKLVSIIYYDVDYCTLNIRPGEEEKSEFIRPDYIYKKMNSFIKKQIYSNNLTSSNKKSAKEIPIIQIAGNIKKKVPFLHLMYGKYKIVNNDLNCQNAYFDGMEHIKSNYKVTSDYFLDNYQREIDEKNEIITSENFHVGEYAIVLEYNNDPIRIDYHDNFVKIFVIDNEITDNEFQVPFDVMKKLGIITTSNNITINKADETISQIRNINITIMEYVKIPGEDIDEGTQLKSLLEKTKIKLTATGWKDSPLKPNVSFTFDENMYEIEKTDATDLAIVENPPITDVGDDDGDGDSDDESSNEKNEGSKSSKSKTPMIIGISVAAAVVVIGIVIVVVVVIVSKKKISVDNSSSNQ